MGISKVDYGGRTLIDLTQDNITPEDVNEGITFHDASGEPQVGTRRAIVAVEEKDVNFWGYDGTLLYSYTLEEAQAMTELPPAPNPQKDFLRFAQWNWTLEEIQSKNGVIDVGALYATTDGKSRFVVEFKNSDDLSLTFNFRGKGTIEWGDGTSETFSDGGIYTIRAIAHTYAAKGKYTILFSGTPETGFYSYGYADQSLAVIGDSSYKSNGRLIEAYAAEGHNIASYRAFIKCRSLRICTNANFNAANAVGNSAFLDCVALDFFAATRGNALSAGAFNGCRSLRVCSVPPTVTDYGSNYIFRNNSSLYNARINEGTKTLPSYFFYEANNLKSLTVPASVTTINAMAFYSLNSLERLIFEGETPPSVANANAFQNIAAYCRVEVPAASLTAYQQATNYGNIAAQMVGV